MKSVFITGNTATAKKTHTQKKSKYRSSHGDNGGHIIKVADGHPNKRDEASQEKSSEWLASLRCDRKETQEWNDAILSNGLQ